MTAKIMLSTMQEPVLVIQAEQLSFHFPGLVLLILTVLRKLTVLI
jgi:hypothetical protein